MSDTQASHARPGIPEADRQLSIDGMLGVLRPRSGPEIIDAALVLARRDYAALVRIAALIFLPYLVLEVTVLSRPASIVWLDMLVWYVVEVLAAGAMAHAIAEAYHGRPVDPRRSIDAVLRRAPLLLASVALKWLFVLAGAILLLVPGILLAVGLFAVVPVVMLEGHAGAIALHRSLSLADGGRWRILGVLTTVTILVWVVELSITTIPVWVLGDAASLEARVLGTVVTALAAPLLGAVPVLLYYDQRIRREGYDLEVHLPAVTA